MAYNMLNMHKGFKEGPLSSVKHREIHEAPPGYTYVIADSSQIEPRVANYLAGNWEFLEYCKTMSPYQAAAIREGVWTADQGTLQEVNPTLYALKKASTIGLNYGVGFQKFIDMVPGYIYPVPLDDVIPATCSDDQYNAFVDYLKRLDGYRKNKAWMTWLMNDVENDDERRRYANSWKIVSEWRLNNPKILALWYRLEESFKSAAQAGEPVWDLPLPSGRELHYWAPQWIRQRGEKKLAAFRTCHPGRGVNDLKVLYSGKFLENYTQATARDVFCYQAVRVYKELGYYIPWTVYDEMIVQVPVSEAEQAVVGISKIMHEPPPWMARLPVSCSKPKITKCYIK